MTSTLSINSIGIISNFISLLSADSKGKPSCRKIVLVPTPKENPEDPLIETLS